MQAHKHKRFFQSAATVTLAFLVMFAACKQRSQAQSTDKPVATEAEFKARVARQTLHLLNKLEKKGVRGGNGDYGCFSADNRWLVTAHGLEGTMESHGWVILWDVRIGKPVRTWSMRGDRVYSEHYHTNVFQGALPSGIHFAQGSSEEAVVTTDDSPPRTIHFNINLEGKTLPSSKSQVDAERPQKSCKFAPKEGLVESDRLSDTLSVVKLPSSQVQYAIAQSCTGNLICKLPSFPKSANPMSHYDPSFSTSPDAKHIFASNRDNRTIYIVQLPTCESAGVIEGTFTKYGHLFNPEGDVVVMGDDSTGTIRLHDIMTGRMIQDLGEDSEWEQPLVFSEDGSMLAAIGNDEITLWSR